ncbi:unnamed protein product [Linum tenue]|uniref:Non-structural maintenance of chromosomes element 4 n=1 Tax=Linum tenue TaxID=586396 RepID=A0AAV0JDR8_9ROSI|nr:unnamed protein product [Linum tenue]
MTRPVKREPGTGPVKREPGAGPDNVAAAAAGVVDLSDCRVLRSQYHTVQNLIQGKNNYFSQFSLLDQYASKGFNLNSPYFSFAAIVIADEADDIGSAESNKFNTIFNQLQSLHERVTRPREQLADAEALLGITSSLVKGAKINSNAVTPSKFIDFVLRDFGRVQHYRHSDRKRTSVNWQKIGVSVAHIFQPFRGCSTMVGTNSAVKQRKPAARRGRRRPSEKSALPKQVDPQVEEQEKTGTTDGTMVTMFSILRKERKVDLEHLILNSSSFSQTVENLFALSFLVKDGRVEIQVDDESGRHIVSPRNAPSATMIASGDVSYRHFVFKFDYSDWQLMCSSVGDGKELMPHRTQEASSAV